LRILEKLTGIAIWIDNLAFLCGQKGELMMKILAYKSNDSKGGESIVIRTVNAALVCTAEDIDEIILALMKAKLYAVKSEVGDDAKEFELDFEQ